MRTHRNLADSNCERLRGVVVSFWSVTESQLLEKYYPLHGSMWDGWRVNDHQVKIIKHSSVPKTVVLTKNRIPKMDGITLSIITKGNILKYRLRAGKKTSDPRDDIKKADDYENLLTQADSEHHDK